MRQHSSAYINSIGTAVPAYSSTQQKAAEFMADVLQLDERDSRRLMALYRHTRIDRRHTVLADYVRPREEYTFYTNSPGMEPFPTVGQRMRLYRQEAVPLALKAIRDCFATYPAFDPQTITHLITVSCTGLYAPGPDIELIEALGLPTTTQRLAINFMGCYGAFNGLKTADAIVRADREAKVLVVCVELCTIHFQKKNETDHLLSNALFADGSAAVIVEGEPRPDQAFRLRSFYCDLLPEGKEAMAWHVSDFGFEMTLTSAVPTFIQQGIGQLMERLLNQCQLTLDDIGQYALHPGGRRILEVIEQQLGITAHDDRHAYEVLRQNGNMSSATVLFVLKEIWNELATGEATIHPERPNILSCAFGPGLTLESMVLEAVMAEPEYASVESSSASAQVL
ncbi:type III polyketide synthase [Spirosoma utsteinense]|uniref:Naringenin-chalcone synthase n=1 Tax=Spirosoma utsteinense TaxID=2585773 RepID=A0ABR6W1N0_9BACT|nr:type III polyketide synthase [Spirosoma utsteinense]MBC3785025.1 putative naringenin-chalcone synthase [Spirosoma utsteinense]MBC3790367.1 putative naringenin-chalcone synthase [Spirosoma utsteinense]